MGAEEGESVNGYCLLGDPSPVGPDPKDLTVQKPHRYRIDRGGVGPGKGAKNAQPTKPGPARAPTHVRMF